MTSDPRKTLLRRARVATLGIVLTAAASTAGLTAVAAASDGPSAATGDDGTSEVPLWGDQDDRGSGTGILPPTHAQAPTQGGSHAS
jgi:hypothetical protein